jgi:hypothetical protein
VELQSKSELGHYTQIVDDDKIPGMSVGGLALKCSKTSKNISQQFNRLQLLRLPNEEAGL